MKLSQKFWKRLSDLYDSTLCQPKEVAKQGHAAVKPFAGKKITVGIPHYNRGNRIHRPLRNLLNDPRVGEVVICDDASSAEEFSALQRNVRSLDPQGKVRIVRHEKNLGAMANKLSCAENASSEWLIILDSDNTIFRNYLDAIYALPSWDPQVIYSPSWAFPYFPFKRLIGERLDFDRVVELCRDNTLKRVYYLNDGNYFVNRKAYTEAIGCLAALKHDVADVMVANYLWLSLGNRLQVLPKAHYFHRIDASSFWVRTQEESRRRVFELFDLLESNTRWSPDLLERFRQSASQEK